MTAKLAIFEYSTKHWPFAAILTRDVFRVRQLHLLHQFVSEKKCRLGGTAELTYDDNLNLRKLMQELPDSSPFYQVYHAFMSKVLQPMTGYPLSYSNHPKMRVHLAGTSSVSSFHDDVSVTGRVDQVNLWIPFTDVRDGATMWVESEPGAADYAPIPVNYGQVLVFDGGYLRHGSAANRTGVTRISMDLRFSIKNGKSRAHGLELLNSVISHIGCSCPAQKPVPGEAGHATGALPDIGPGR
jgi:hypothetical protein